MCSDKEILDTRFSFLLTYYDEKKQKREWEMIQNHQAQMALIILYCKSRNDQKENRGLLEEEEWTSYFSCWKGREETLHTHVCGRFDFFPLVVDVSAAVWLRGKFLVQLLVAEPTTRAVTSHGVDATVSFLYSFVFLIISATCSSHLIPCISKWREESKEWNIASFE